MTDPAALSHLADFQNGLLTVRPPTRVSIDQIDLWAKVTVKIDRAIASIAVLLTMSPRLSL
jgi:hypothetical protein